MLALALELIAPTPETPSAAGEIALHADRGGEPALAYRYALMASEAAVHRYAFQEALKAYGDMIGAQPPTPFAHLREGLTREVDPCVNPQALLQQGLETDAGLEVPRDASFPGDAARPRRFYIAFAIKGGSVAVYSLDDMDGAFARLAEHDAAAATAATAATGPDPTAAAGSNAPARRRPSWSCRTP